MKRKGPRAKSSKSKARMQKGSIVKKTIGGKEYQGVVSMWDEHSGKIVVAFEQGESVVLEPRDVDLVDDASHLVHSIPVHSDQPGFYQYPVQWMDMRGEPLVFGKPTNSDPTEAVAFRLRAEGVDFYGSWRKTREYHSQLPAYAIDIFADYKGQKFCLPVIFYTHGDPRVKANVEENDEYGEASTSQYIGMRELNADICVAVNRWLHFHAAGNMQTLEDLKMRADHPVLNFKTFQGLRTMIQGLIDLYETSAKCGGYRLFELRGEEKDPPVRIQTELTSNWMALASQEQSPPSSPRLPDEVGEVPGDVPSPIKPSSTSGGKRRGRRSSGPSISPSMSLKELQARLEAINKISSGDRSEDERREAKKIRQRIRELRK